MDVRQISADAEVMGDGWTAAPGRSGASAQRGQPPVPLPNPFSMFGMPCSPMRMMFAPLEIALFLPAYAIDSFHGHRGSRNRR